VSNASTAQLVEIIIETLGNQKIRRGQNFPAECFEYIDHYKLNSFTIIYYFHVLSDSNYRGNPGNLVASKFWSSEFLFSSGCPPQRL
jgi:hypothetical protein